MGHLTGPLNGPPDRPTEWGTAHRDSDAPSPPCGTLIPPGPCPCTPLAVQVINHAEVLWHQDEYPRNMRTNGGILYVQVRVCLGALWPITTVSITDVS